MTMQNAIDGLDEMDDIDFGSEDHPLLRQIGEALGWLALLVGFVLAVTHLTPPQRSAEADLFDAECRAKEVAP
jgi:hypothetical protein